MRKGFTMIELLVVVGILAILMGVLIVSFKSAPMKAEAAKGLELVKNVQVALTQVFDKNGIWPEVLIKNSGTTRGLDAKAGYPLRNLMGLSYNEGSRSLTKLNKFGIVTPWAEQVIKNLGDACTENDEVPGIGGTIADHRLRYALSLDGQGTVKNVNVASTIDATGIRGADETVNIRAIAAVWSRGPKGEFIRSWSDGDTEGVN